MYLVKDIESNMRTYITDVDLVANFHKHNDIQMGFYETGPILYQLGERVYRVEAYEYIMCWGNIPHRLHEASQNNKQWWLVVPLQNVIEWDLPKHVLNRLFSGELLKIRDPDYNELDKLAFTQWTKDIKKVDKVYKEIALACLEARFRRFAMLYDTHKIDTGLIAHQDSTIFAGIYQYIRDNFTKKITIDDIAAHLNIHPNYAMTVCKKSSGLTISSIIARLRVQEAERLLKSSDLSIVDIAHESGFLTISNFYKTFNKYNGNIPKDYRANSAYSKKNRKK